MKDYQNLWNMAAVLPQHAAEVTNIVTKIKANKSRYDTVSTVTKVPWYVIAVIHYREASLNFNCHLHNGDPLKARTVHVPKGRPLVGDPPFTWEQSAEDAIKLESLDVVTDWQIPMMLWVLEKYNGLGYQKKAINSPYLWSFTNQYEKGKFTSDHGFDPNVVDQQCGCVPLLKQLIII